MSKLKEKDLIFKTDRLLSSFELKQVLSITEKFHGLDEFINESLSIIEKERLLSAIGVCCLEYNDYLKDKNESLRNEIIFPFRKFDCAQSKKTEIHSKSVVVKALSSHTVKSIRNGLWGVRHAFSLESIPNELTTSLDNNLINSINDLLRNFNLIDKQLLDLLKKAQIDEKEVAMSPEKIRKTLVTQSVITPIEKTKKISYNNIFLTNLFKIHSDFYAPVESLKDYDSRREFVLHKAQFASFVLVVLPGKTMRFSKKDLDQNTDEDDWCRLSDAARLFTNRYHPKF